MGPYTVSRGALILLLTCSSAQAAAQPAGGEPPQPAPSPPAGSPSEGAPAPPSLPPPPPPPPPPPSTSSTPPSSVQTFEPADVTGPKAGDAGPISIEPTKTAPGALPLTMDEMPIAGANNPATLNMFGDTAFVVDSVTPRQPGFIIGDLDLLITARAANVTAMAKAALEQRGGGEVGIDLERVFVGWRG